MPREIYLGLAMLDYDKEGKPIHAEFQAAGHVVDINKLQHDLTTTPAATSEIEALHYAQTILADWVRNTELRLDNLELLDRESTSIKSDMVVCQKWSNGKPQTCHIRFTLNERGDHDKVSTMVVSDV